MVDQFQLTYPCGIHARPSAAIVAFLKGFDAKVVFTNDRGESSVADNVLGLLALGIQPGPVVVETSGRQEQEAMAAVAAFINKLNTEQHW